MLTLLTLGCRKNDPVIELAPGTIEGQTFNSTVLIDGHDFDGTILKNCVFENIDGDGLQIRDVNDLCIEGCVFRNISENAIRFRNSGGSDGVKIIGNEIYDIKENGILAPEDHINTRIKGNTIHNVATDNTSSQFGAPHHGIYFQGFNVEITENAIYDVRNDQGNCISIRTYGTISKNKLYKATDHGISYYSDHPGDAKKLLIENNFIYDNGKRGINLASNGTTANHIGAAEIRFNTILSNSSSPIALQDDLVNVGFDLTANVLIRTDGGSNFVYTSLPYTDRSNLTDANDIGFVDFTNRDLHITSGSSAENYVGSLADFPAVDYDGNIRDSLGLDAGADEI